ncbi:MAG: Rrf2 family transcriptional regulator [Pseudomonadota bacterium]|nr:Rrf2 family transcriptional regulator [Pseudomonadota bacterium]
MNHSIVPISGEYALRAAVCLAALPAEGWMTAKDLAVIANVPPAFLAKVLRRLAVHGLLLAQKGHHGGFRLARPAASIRVLDVLQAAEIELNTGHCAFGFARCNEAAPCPLHDVYKDLQQMCHTWARANTLADVDVTRIPRLERAPE